MFKRELAHKEIFRYDSLPFSPFSHLPRDSKCSSVCVCVCVHVNVFSISGYTHSYTHTFPLSHTHTWCTVQIMMFDIGKHAAPSEIALPPFANSPVHPASIHSLLEIRRCV